MTTDVISSTNLYAEVQQFYAMQMQRLDRRDIEGYAATFTEDAEFFHTPGHPASHTRANILSDLHEFHKQFPPDLQRRHWFNMVNLELQDDGSIKSTTYCLVIKILPEQKPEIAPSCVVNDILVRVNGELLTQYRRVDHD